jgi:hypothetical protein
MLNRRSRWRWWIAGYVIAALALPALGPLPWLLAAVDGGAPVIAAHEHEHAHGAASHVHHHHDASDVPGSPTHPADHNCFACQVLAHLGRWLAIVAPSPALPWPAASFPAPPPARAVALPFARFAFKPPARAPPLLPA